MRKPILSISIIIALLTLVACGAQSRSGSSPQAAAKSESKFYENAETSSGEPGTPGQPATNLAAAVENRLRVKNGTMTLTVPDVKAAEEALAKAADKYSGYVALSQIDSGSAIVTLKIPAEKFDALVAEVEKLGTLKQKQVTVEDVTEQYLDLDTRIKNKRILLSRYQDYLRKAVNTKELLDLEQAINAVTTEIESLEGTFRSLKNSIAYSSLTLTVELPPEQKTESAAPSFAVGLAMVGNFLVNFLYYLLLTIMYTLIVVVPLTLLAGLIYYVGFGRIGLVLKFFRALGRKKG